MAYGLPTMRPVVHGTGFGPSQVLAAAQTLKD